MLSSSKKFRQRWPMMYFVMRMQLGILIGWTVGCIFGYITAHNFQWRPQVVILAIVEAIMPASLILAYIIYRVQEWWRK